MYLVHAMTRHNCTIEIEIEMIHNNTGKLDRLLSILPLYLAIQDL
jgi:hypothetical protein